MIKKDDEYKISYSPEEIEDYWYDEIKKITNLMGIRSTSLWYIQENLIQKAKKEQKSKSKI